jgi:transcriptional regulator with GAF, ATPase, and Fis domain
MTRPSNILCLPTENAGNGGLLVADRPSMDELQRRYLQFILEETGWNRRRTAAVLNLDRRTVQRLIARYQLRSAAAGSLAG